MENTLPRKLNMEEKRKLEKLLLADIESAATAYSTERSTQRDDLEKDIEQNPPALVAKLFQEWKRVHQSIEDLERSLEAFGYHVSTGYGSNKGGELDINGRYSQQPKPLRDFDDHTRARRDKLAELKRSYTLKLFAGGAEAQELFAALAAEITTLTK